MAVGSSAAATLPSSAVLRVGLPHAQASSGPSQMLFGASHSATGPFSPWLFSILHPPAWPWAQQGSHMEAVGPGPSRRACPCAAVGAVGGCVPPVQPLLCLMGLPDKAEISKTTYSLSLSSHFFTPLLRVLFSVRKWDCAPGNTVVSPDCNALSNWNMVACLPNVILHTRCVIWKGSVEARTTCIPHFTICAIRVSSPLILRAKLNACRTSTELFASWGLDSAGLPRIQLQRLHHNDKYFWIS